MHQLYRSDKNESSFWAELRLSKKLNTFANAEDSPDGSPPSQSTKSAMRYSFGASSEDMNNLSFEHVTGTLNALRMLSSRSRNATAPTSSVKSQRISNKAVKMRTSMFDCSCMSTSAVVPDLYQSGKGGGVSELNAALSHFDEDELSLSSSLDNPTGAANQRRRRRSLLIAETSLKSATTHSFAIDDGDNVSAYGDDDDDDATSGVFGSTNKSTKGSTKSKRSLKSKGSSKKLNRTTLTSSSGDDVSMFGNEEELDELFIDEQAGISGKTLSQDEGHGKYCLCGCRSY